MPRKPAMTRDERLAKKREYARKHYEENSGIIRERHRKYYAQNRDVGKKLTEADLQRLRARMEPAKAA